MNKRPFDSAHVMRETFKHLARVVATSQQKTLSRMPEFEGDSQMSGEILLALSNLNKLNELIASIKEANKEMTRGEND